jgi:hypothetical protein
MRFIAKLLDEPGFPMTKIGIWFKIDMSIIKRFSKIASFNAIPSKER